MTRNTENNDSRRTARMIEYLSGFMLPEREKVLRETLASRTRYMTICLENTYHPQNASALVRSCEAFGIQDIHTVETVCRFTPNANIVRGTDKWVDIRKHSDTPSLVDDLRARGYRIVATSPHADDRTPETFDVEAGPFARFFGTEHAGISEEVVAAADEFVRIPMCGFVESLNVSASAAILLYLLVAAEGERRAVAHSGDRARRNPAALDALDRARFRTYSPAGGFRPASAARAPCSA
ncbi:MAG: TrmH family RNA methyltransferase [Alistipes sp.]